MITVEENEKIFIQIASYRDPELVPTLRDCLKNAKNPENLVFCIAWQHGENESLEEFKDHPQVKVIDIPYETSMGACWARHQIQQRYDGEKYTLQLDSHHRFADNWDEMVIGMFNQLREKGFEKPLLTGYISSYDPENDPGARVNVPWRMNFDRFIPEGAIFFLPASIDDWKSLSEPIPARFYSAHFAFTLGKFCLEVPHDPEYYFHGEEISIGVRAFTCGYDLFHPHKIIAWHEYTRKGRTKHWDDHNKWGKLNEQSHLRNRKLFSMDGIVNDVDFGRYGFGSARTVRDYEKYAGVSFKRRAVQKHTLDNKLPPNPLYATDEEFDASFLKIFKHCIDVHKGSLLETDYDFWVVAFHDSENNTLYRKDVTEQEVNAYQRSKEDFYKIWREFQTDTHPSHWIVWPHSKSKGWCNKIEQKL